MSQESGVPFCRRWNQAVTARLESPFLVWADNDQRTFEYSYREFDGIVQHTAAELQSFGVTLGTRVQLSLGNSPHFIAIWLASVRIGAVMVPTDPRGTSDEFAKQMGLVTPSLVVCSLDTESMVRRAMEESGHGAPPWVVEERDDSLLRANADQTYEPGPAPTSESPGAVLFTSGTTSAPKGAVITQGNYAFAGDIMSASAAMTPDDRMLVVLPLFHANAQYYSFAAAICAGSSVAMTSAFSATRFLKQAEEFKATCASLFAAPIKMILAKGERPDTSLRLRHVWYAQSISDNQYEEFAGLVGCRPRQLYGMTETVAAVITNRALAPVHDRLGEPTIGTEVTLLDPVTGVEVDQGQAGEIAVGGMPGKEIFAGYLGPDGLHSAMEDGWFRTGDLATQDESGNYWFVGRRGDMLKVSGENVSTVEVEDVISSHPNVLEVAVVGAPDDIRDEVPVAFVVARAVDLTPDELREWCESRLASYKRPREITLVDDLPRTSVGKVRKFRLTQDGPESAGNAAT